MQVFWFDSFDGMMTAIYDGQVWSEPLQTNLAVKTETNMPDVFQVSSGWINAYWLEPETGRFTGSILKYSSTMFGRTSWEQPSSIARSVLAFDVTEMGSGNLLTYLQGQNLNNAPAGVYMRRNFGANTVFDAPKLVYDDPYIRSLTSEQAYIQSVTTQPSTLEQDQQITYLYWADPLSGGAVFIQSSDRGSSWSEAVRVEPPTRGDTFRQPRLLYTGANDSLLLLWKTGQDSACAAYQQTSTAGSQELRFSPPGLISQALPACPPADRLLAQAQGGLWLWGEGTGRLGLMRWNVAENWLMPFELSYQVQEAGIPGVIQLDDLHAGLVGDQLMVVGRGVNVQDIWFTSTRVSSLTASEPEPVVSPWSEPQRIDIGDSFLSQFSVGLDQDAKAHIVWSQRPRANGAGASLFYVQAEKEKTSRSVEIVKPAEGTYNPQLSLVVERQPDDEDNLLHMVWSGGQDGGILYSYALASEALAPISWSLPTVISGASVGEMPAGAAWPQLLVVPDHQLYVLYDIPLNEKRGIYLVYSSDSGKSWSAPVQVFDAAKASWQMVDHPSLAVSPDGILHAAWVKRPLPGMGQPSGIYYARSVDGGSTWSVPLMAAEAGFDWPVLVSTQNQMNLIYLNTADGSLIQRFYALEDASDSTVPRWSAAFNILQEKVQSQLDSPHRPFTISASQNSIYLAGVRQGTTDLFYSTYSGEVGESRWAAGEVVTIPQQNGVQVLSSSPGGIAVLPDTGVLAVGILQSVSAADGAEQPNQNLVVSSRSVAVEEMLSVTVRVPEPVSEPGAAPAEQPVPAAVESTQISGGAAGAAQPSGQATLTAAAGQTQPTPTLAFQAGTNDRSLPVIPPVLGIILAALTIVVAMLFRFLRVRERT